MMRLAPLLVLGLICACSDGIGPGDAAELSFATDPGSMARGDALAPPVAVAVHDGGGSTVLDWSEDITLTLQGGQAGAALEGPATGTPLAGIAIFDSLRVPAVGTGYRLVARSGGLVEAVSAPFDVHEIFQAAALTAGSRHTCALSADGTAYCWGANWAGQLGTGDTEDRTRPTPVVTEVRFSSLTANGSHTCGLAAGALYCWGANGFGQLGEGTTDSRSLLQAVPLPDDPVGFDPGSAHTCALLADGTAWCWGDNWGGALGIGVADSIRTSPVQVTGGQEWAKIEAGYLHTCGLTTTGEAYCWGPNIYGANGTGDRDPVYSPTAVVGGHTFTDLVAGGAHCHGATCGVTTDGTVMCWGKNYQRNIGTSSDLRWLEPTPLVGDPGLVSVMVGPQMVCGFTADDEPHCLGNPLYGMLPYAEAPILLVPEMDVAALGMGETSTCIVTTASDVYCWGVNDRGQLGTEDISGGWRTPRGVWAPDGG